MSSIMVLWAVKNLFADLCYSSTCFHWQDTLVVNFPFEVGHYFLEYSLAYQILTKSDQFVCVFSAFENLSRILFRIRYLLSYTISYGIYLLYCMMDDTYVETYHQIYHRLCFLKFIFKFDFPEESVCILCVFSRVQVFLPWKSHLVGSTRSTQEYRWNLDDLLFAHQC